jgi:hypothetical protein
MEWLRYFVLKTYFSFVFYGLSYYTPEQLGVFVSKTYKVMGSL